MARGRTRGQTRIAAAAILILGTVLAGCGGRHGSIRFDAAAGRACEEARLLPGHRYYTTGSESAPDALLALREDRPLANGRWREVAAEPAVIARLLDRMRGSRAGGPHGRVVLDDRGAPVGLWCSWLDPLPVRLLDDGGVAVEPPIPAGGPAGFPGMRRGE